MGCMQHQGKSVKSDFFEAFRLLFSVLYNAENRKQHLWSEISFMLRVVYVQHV